ncbi:probable leucine-rich repeat receptor-like protein kinase At5g49770 [Dioscorea cayenensis subsp. rotundata]|uniref:Probable leucine-rich repeat receptor-like protein kinase At5g49770 n=1 Tax=Dioscorea cayennensis subsp. rotundata TaxID=55577 RepID=A0AB40C3K6_DIOCR|nr:probable leucine-rich repeat receptor-like protein kinase At5g49770 [Dioscorea cayenensis subsp. rotundata]
MGKKLNKQENPLKRSIKRRMIKMLWFKKDVRRMSEISHPNILKMLGYYETFNLQNKSGLILEYMPRGKLCNYLFASKKPLLKWKSRIDILLNVSSSLAYLHDTGLIYGNLKSDNILLDSLFVLYSDEKRQKSKKTPEKSNQEKNDEDTVVRKEYQVMECSFDQMKQFFRQLKPLGGEAFQVYSGKHLVAVKHFAKSDKVLKDARRICHPNILKILGYYETFNLQNKSGLALEYMPEGSLYNYLFASKKPILKGKTRINIL